MALQMNDVFAKHGINLHVCAYVKDGTNNISTMAFN
jgi:hypothetical protein